MPGWDLLRAARTTETNVEGRSALGAAVVRESIAQETSRPKPPAPGPRPHTAAPVRPQTARGGTQKSPREQPPRPPASARPQTAGVSLVRAPTRGCGTTPPASPSADQPKRGLSSKWGLIRRVSTSAEERNQLKHSMQAIIGGASVAQYWASPHHRRPSTAPVKKRPVGFEATLKAAEASIAKVEGLIAKGVDQV